MVLALSGVFLAIVMGICTGLYLEGSPLLPGNIFFCIVGVIAVPLFYLLIIGLLPFFFSLNFPRFLVLLYAVVSSGIGFKVGMMAARTTLF